MFRYGVCLEVTSPVKLRRRDLRSAFTATHWSMEEFDQPIAVKAYDTFDLPRIQHNEVKK